MCCINKYKQAVIVLQLYYAALLPRSGPHIASHSVCLSVRPSVCLSVCLSVRLSVRPSRYRTLPSVTSRHLANYNDTHVLFGMRRATYRTAISAAQILVRFSIMSFLWLWFGRIIWIVCMDLQLVHSYCTTFFYSCSYIQDNHSYKQSSLIAEYYYFQSINQFNSNLVAWELDSKRYAVEIIDNTAYETNNVHICT